MSLPDPSSLREIPGAVLADIGNKIVQIIVSPGTFSLASLLCALCVAMLFLGLKRQRRGRGLRVKVLLRAVFPKRLRVSRSSRTDVAFFVFSVFVVGLFLGWAALSAQVVNGLTNQLLAHAFGAMRRAPLSDLEAAAVMTLVLFVAYELGYWIDHYLSHNVPFLWEFHKVHHTAEVLSPLTNFRVHPVDTIVFNNILALAMGGAGGIANYLLGQTARPLTVADSNVIVVVLFFLIGHLQHTHFWIAFTGVWGRILLSPAHHQIHHSTNPAHFNKNLGSSLAIWDWLFGTLHVPQKTREKLTFGVDPRAEDVHTMRGELISPLRRAFALLKPRLSLRGGLDRRRATRTI
jgi:sterol desaturase/sphingolipid hydroxylase (fatty acid hydroxylase superfamily)